MISSEKCVCGSGKQFAYCCGRFLTQGKIAKTPTQLMRSRYSAFALGGYGDYLLKTWVRNKRPNSGAAALSQIDTEWIDLDIVSSFQKGNNGVVEFIATYRQLDGTLAHHHERSIFIRHLGRWYYDDGDILNK